VIQKLLCGPTRRSNVRRAAGGYVGPRSGTAWSAYLIHLLAPCLEDRTDLLRAITGETFTWHRPPRAVSFRTIRWLRNRVKCATDGAGVNRWILVTPERAEHLVHVPVERAVELQTSCSVSMTSDRRNRISARIVQDRTLFCLRGVTCLSRVSLGAGDLLGAALPLQLQPGYLRAVDLVGTVGEAQGTSGGPEVSEGEVVGDAGGAVGLYRPI
jgi:hypothetical protein